MLDLKNHHEKVILQDQASQQSNREWEGGLLAPTPTDGFWEKKKQFSSRVRLLTGCVRIGCRTALHLGVYGQHKLESVDY